MVIKRQRDMTPKKKTRLGRGLGALLGEVQTTTLSDSASRGKAAPSQAPRAGPTDRQTGYRELPIELLQRGRYQPRLNMDKTALEELAESIRAQGVVQPLLVRRLGPQRYEIIAGERRWRGAQLAGLTRVPAVVRDISDQAAMAVGLIENIQREDLNAIDQAKGFQRLLDEFGLTHQEVAQAVGRSRVAVSNLVRLLSLHPAVQQKVETGDLDMGHARALLGLPEPRQAAAADTVIAKGLSVRKTERLVKQLLKTTASPPQTVDRGADIVRLEEELSGRISAKVEIRHRSNKGQLVIHYHSLDELDGILERIQ